MSRRRTYLQRSDTVELLTQPALYRMPGDSYAVTLPVHVVIALTINPSDKPSDERPKPALWQHPRLTITSKDETSRRITLPRRQALRLGDFFSTITSEDFHETYECHDLPSYIHNTDLQVGKRQHRAAIRDLSQPATLDHLEVGKPYMAVQMSPTHPPLIRHTMIGLGDGPITEQHPEGEYAQLSLHVIDRVGPLAVAHTATVMQFYQTDRLYPITYTK